MRGIIKYFIENPVLVNLGLTIIVFTGAWQLSLIKTNNVPASKIRTLSVSVVYPGASPQEVEEGVVIKIEENLEGVQGIKQFTSESKENQGTITIELWERADPDVVLDEVKNAVEKINSFPRNMEQPIIIKVEPVERVIDLLLVGNAPLQVLKDYAEKMKDDLIRNDGFSQVTIAGYPEEEIEISIRDNSLTRYNLTFDEVVQAIQDANLETTGGEIKNKERNVQIRARSQSYYAKDLKNIIVRAREDG
ncbi:MAG: efflux RND transporter permease subunit, partial [Cytophagales bacterium]|nr:efflux RND transporter permease subunit [Cytophagales bacterium]